MSNILKPEPIHYATLTEEDIKKLQKKSLIKNIIDVTVGTIIYSVGLVWIMQLCGFFAGGMSGVSQLIIALVQKYGTNDTLKTILADNLGSLILICNIPLLAFSWKGVSKKFALLTVLSLVLQFIFSNLLSSKTISPFIYLINNDVENLKLGEGLIEFLQQGNKFFISSSAESAELIAAFKNGMLPGTRILMAIFGGIVCAIGCSMCLKGGGSTGGVDIVANYLYSRKHISFTKFQSAFDTTIIIASSLISVENVLYTLIRLFIYTIAIREFYKSYTTNRIEIVTNKANDIQEILLKKFSHSLTIFRSVGGYSHAENNTIVVYANEFEVKGYIDIIKDTDPGAFITVTPAQIVRSNFVHKTI